MIVTHKKKKSSGDCFFFVFFFPLKKCSPHIHSSTKKKGRNVYHVHSSTKY